jgi:site-specific DNA-methyltransferase (adenine-specific)
MFFQSDAIELPLPDGSVDLIITDPPFGIDFDGKASNYNRNPDNVYNVYRELNLNNIPSIVYQFNRILKPYGSLWIVMGWNNLYLWELFSQGYFNQIGHVIWKYQFGVYTKRKPVTSHYHLLVYTKNNNHWTWNRQGYDEDVWIINRPYQKGGLKYPNKLPDEVAKQMIIRSSNEGDIVYDPFTGSGTIPKVARELGRVGIGSDLLNNKEFWNG